MNTTGSRESAMAPTTILVLKRAPSWSLLRSAQRRTTERTRMRPKTRAAAVIKLETANSESLARQLPGSNGTSSEPKVKTAARSRDSRIPPIARLQRCLGGCGLMWGRWSFLATYPVMTPGTAPMKAATKIQPKAAAPNRRFVPLALPAAETSAGIRRSAVLAAGRSACRCERSERGIHYTARRREKGCARRVAGLVRNRALGVQGHGVRGCAACRRPPQKRGDGRRREEWNRRFPDRCRARREVARAGWNWARETFWPTSPDTAGGGNERRLLVFWLSGGSNRRSE